MQASPPSPHCTLQASVQWWAHLGATTNRRPELSRAAVENLWLPLRHHNGASLQKFSPGAGGRLGNSEPMANVRGGANAARSEHNIV